MIHETHDLLIIFYVTKLDLGHIINLKNKMFKYFSKYTVL